MTDPIFLAPIGLGPFENGAMLAWGLVSVIPILLHFLYRRRKQTVEWAAMRFLAEAIQDRSSHFRLWQWFLLLLRVLAILLMAIGLANPLVQSFSSTAVSEPRTELQVLVLDASYSMRAKIDDQRRCWDLAIQAAIEVCDRVSANAPILVVAMENPSSPVVQRASTDHNAVRTVIASMKPGQNTADVPQTLRLIQTLLADFKKENPQNQQVRVTFFSDLQRDTWRSVFESDIKQRWKPLEDWVTVDVVDVTEGFKRVPNVTVSEVTLRPNPPYTHQPTTILATLKQSGATSEIRSTVQLEINGQIQSSKRILIDANSSSTASFSWTFSPGQTEVAVRVGADSLMEDNRCSVLLDIPDRLRVLCVGTQSQTQFFKMAIESGTESMTDTVCLPLSQIEQVTEDLFDVLVICDIPGPDIAIMERIQRTLQQRGGILWWLGPEVIPDLFTTFNALSPERPLPFVPSATVSHGTEPLNAHRYEHPVVAPFSPFPQSGLLSTPVFRYWQVDLSDKFQQAVALSISSSQDPLLVTFDWKLGRLALFTTPPYSVSPSQVDAPPWNAWVAWPSFVPLVQEALRWAAQKRIVSQTIWVGQSLQEFHGDRQACVEEIIRPNGDSLSTTLQKDAGKGWQWTSPPLREPGVYELRDFQKSSRRIHVRIDPQEGDLEKTVAEPGVHSSVADDVPSKEAIEPTDRPRYVGLFSWILIAAVGVLIVESLLAGTLLK